MATFVHGRKFDWEPNHDPKSRNFRAVTGVMSLRTSRRWVLRNGVLDQGEEGACVGHGTINAASTPRMRIILPDPQKTAFGMYYGSRRIDEWPGEDYDGTSVNAGCKLAVEFGLASGYRWCFGVEEVAQVILDKSPVIIGVNYLEDMFNPSPLGLVSVSGAVAGGHCMCVIGFYRNGLAGLGINEPVFCVRQSWGTSFGAHGNIFITYDGMNKLLQDQGEAAVLEPIPYASIGRVS